MKRLFKLAFAVVVAIGLLSGAALAAEAGTVVVAQGADPTSLDVIMHREVPTYNVTMNIFDSLILRKADGSFAPALATSWEAVDETTWDLELRTGVEFHNGEPFNAAAVKFTIEKILDPETKSARRTGYTWIESVEIIDDYTIRIKTKEPYPLALANLAELQIVPPEYYQEVGSKGFNEHPIGTGPFKFVSWTKDVEVVLTANKNYWRGAPEISKLVFKPIPSAMTRVASLISGEVDLIVNVPPSLIPQVEAVPTARAQTVTGCRVIFVGLDTTQDTPLQNKKVRQAINYAVNVDSIIENLLDGLGTKTTTLLTAADLGYNPECKPYPYDPEKARQLLAEAGYPDGFEIDMDTPSGRYVNDVEVAQAIAGQLAEVGIKVNVNVREFGSYNTAVFSHTQAPMYFLGWGNPVFDADYIYYFLLRSDILLSNYHNEELNKLLDKGHNTVDLEVRQEAYHKAMKLINDEAPMLFLYKQKDAYGISKRLDWTPRSDEFLWMYEAKLVD